MSPLTPSFTIRVLPWDEARAMARPLREAVFVHEQGVPIEQEWDELRGLGEKYRALEKDIKEKISIWEKLKAMPPPTLD